MQDAKQNIESTNSFGVKVAATCLALSFLPVSINTPAGFLSPVDLVVIVMFISGVVRAFSGLPGSSRRISSVFYSFLCFALLFLSQLLSEKENGVSVLVKYAEFLILIPFGLYLNGVNARSFSSAQTVSSILSWSGFFLSALIMLQLARGSYAGGGGGYSVNILGTFVNKNGLGAILLFGLAGSLWESSQRGNNIHLISWVVQIFVIAFIGNRSATIVGILMIAFSYLALGKKSAGQRVLYIAILAVFSTIVFTAINFGLFSDQVERLLDAANTDTNNLTASNSRILLWKYGLAQFFEKPLLGWGYGAFSYEGRNWLYGMYEPHNSIIQILYSGGLLGAVAFTLVIFRSLIARFPERGFYIFAIASYVANSMVAIIWVRFDGHLFWILVGLAAMAGSDVEQRHSLLASRRVHQSGDRLHAGRAEVA